MRDTAERAIEELAAARPRVVTATLYHYPTLPLYSESGGEPFLGKKEIRIPSGSVFFARLSGEGTMAFRHGKGFIGYQFRTPLGTQPAVLQGDIPDGDGEITLTLSAGRESRLLNLAVYDLPRGTKAPDPDARPSYDLQEIFPDFGALIAPPRDANGTPLRCDLHVGYSLADGHILTLPAHSAGRLTIEYRRRLSISEGGELPLSDAEAALVPLYCAAYVFLDEDAERAAFYLARFREGVRRLDYEGKGAVPYPDNTQWG